MLPHHFSSRLSFVTKGWQSILKRGPIRMQYDICGVAVMRYRQVARRAHNVKRCLRDTGLLEVQLSLAFGYG